MIKYLLIFVIFVTANQVLATQTLCNQHEDVIFNCQISKSKTLSVCASKNLSRKTGYLQYRFGKRRKIELEFPHTRSNTQNAFVYFQYARSLVIYLSLSFNNKGYTYTVYDDDNAEEGKTAFGVRVNFPDGKQVDLACQPNTTKSDLFYLEGIVPEKDWLSD